MMKLHLLRLEITFLIVAAITGAATAAQLEYAPAADDNPLRGLVPYVGASGRDQFPHSLEFRYFPLNKLMTDWGEFDWSPIEKTLKRTGARGNQLILRIYIEYPKRGNDVPQFLIDEGVTVTKWDSGGDGELFTPDYSSLLLRRAMQEFIAAFGKKYDGDPRIGFVTAGLLGKWGEWHDYPRSDLFASKKVQAEVMQAFAAAFPKTKVLLRYPAGSANVEYSSNAQQPFGYHDDSFAWATLDTGREEDDWYFLATLKAAGSAAVSKWKRFPIGGEIRPELWPAEFTVLPHAKQQDFDQCVRETHVTWLMDSGLFDADSPIAADRRARALKHVRKMGYELHVASAALEGGTLRLAVENRGVAPFYYDWPVEVRYSAPNIRTRPLFPDWKLSQILPGKPAVWEVDLGVDAKVAVRVRVANPMPGGKPVRFANRDMNGEWLEITFD